MSLLMSRKICFVTSGRADYGLLRWVMHGVKNDPELQLQIIATGMHLSSTYGFTYQEIEEDGFFIDARIEILGSPDAAIEISESMGMAITGIANAINDLEPDLLVVLGDRYEIFAATAAALVSKTPVAHLHGGEVTTGAFDESFRHAITKMSHLHFVATEEYKSRVIQLGENPQNVFLVGGLGVDGIKKLSLLSREELETRLGFVFGEKSLLITFHPATLDSEAPEHQMRELLRALSSLNDTTLIFTMPNADTGSDNLILMLQDFVENNKRAKMCSSLGQLMYMSCIAQVDGVVGNSSSGLTEVPTFKKGTINVGDRQQGRLQASSVINCEPSEVQIKSAIERLYSPEFKLNLVKSSNPYGAGGASLKIVKVLKEVSLDGIIKKPFYDL
jgi:GDP/UDP-N,N'-diacetylbacillosamine 2-epimerase (hydrolysing)